MAEVVTQPPQEGPADWKKQLNLPARDTRVQTEVGRRAGRSGSIMLWSMHSSI